MLLLVLAVLAANYARTALGPLQETLRAALHLTDNQVALLQGPALAVPVVMAAIPLGFLIDRYVRVRLLLIFAACNLLGSLCTALAFNFELLFLARCVVGLTATATFTAALSLVADLYPPHQRGRATMAVAISQIGGMAAAFALGGWFLTARAASPDSWSEAMLGLTAPLPLVAIAMLAMREPARTGMAVENPSLRQASAALWRCRATLVPLLAGMVMVEMALGAALIWAAPALSRSFDLSPDRVGAVMASGLIVSGVFGPIAGGTLADLCHRAGGPRRTMLVIFGITCVTLPTGAFAFVSGVVAASVLLVAFIMLVSSTCVMGTTLFTVAIPNEIRGICTAAMTGACILFSVGLAPLVVSVISNMMGGPIMIGKALALVGVTTHLVGGVAFALASRRVAVVPA